VQLSERTTLLTGGTGGIGFGIAEAFWRTGSRVIVCGRNKDKLAKAERKLPGIMALPCDVGDAQQRENLAEEVLHRFPDLDILVNNASVQRYIDLTKGYKELTSGDDEIAINLIATVELTALFIGRLMMQPSAAIINVSSGLGFTPMLNTPVYSATKAAVHTYSLVLREQLKATSVRVVEVVPPMVDTDLNKAGRDAARLRYRGISLSAYIPTVLKGLEDDLDTIFFEDGGRVMSEPREQSERRMLKPAPSGGTP
jgi:uncharacterized oxidoreductase